MFLISQAALHRVGDVVLLCPMGQLLVFALRFFRARSKHRNGPCLPKAKRIYYVRARAVAKDFALLAYRRVIT